MGDNEPKSQESGSDSRSVRQLVSILQDRVCNASGSARAELNGAGWHHSLPLSCPSSPGQSSCFYAPLGCKVVLFCTVSYKYVLLSLKKQTLFYSVPVGTCCLHWSTAHALSGWCYPSDKHMLFTTLYCTCLRDCIIQSLLYCACTNHGFSPALHSGRAAGPWSILSSCWPTRNVPCCHWFSTAGISVETLEII